MAVLLIRLAGPMQAWGVHSRFTVRDTGTEPSKSGVVGLLCAACGVSRSDTARIAELAALPMGVRADREGKLMRDFHTAGGGMWPGLRSYGVRRASGGPGETVTSERYYLADADFLVALEGPRPLLERLHAALASPVWPLYLGRKAFVPGEPVRLPDGLRDGDVPSVLRSYPWRKRPHDSDPGRLRLVLECAADEGIARLDVPVSFEIGSRRYSLRYVRTAWVSTGELPRMEEV